MRELGEELNLIPPLIRPLTQGHKESPPRIINPCMTVPTLKTKKSEIKCLQ